MSWLAYVVNVVEQHSMFPHGWLISFCTVLFGQLAILAAGLAPQDGTLSRQLGREAFFAAPRSSKITTDVAALRWEPQDMRSADAMTSAAGDALQLHQQLLRQLIDQQAALLQEQQKLSSREDALLMDTAILAGRSSPRPYDITSTIIFVPPVILVLTMLYAVFSAQPSVKREGVFGKSSDGKSYMTPENILSRWFAVLSGTLTITAGNCIANLSFLAGDGTGTWVSALAYTVIMIDGLLDLTPSEILSLTVDEGIASVAAAMSLIIAQVWYKLIPSSSFIVFAGVCVVVIAGEIWQRSLQKGTMPEFIVQSLNGLNIGSVSWFVGLGLSNHAQNYFGAPDGAS